VELYVRLLADPATMSSYEELVAYRRERSEQRLSEWVGRWQSGDPFSALSIFIKGCPRGKRRKSECGEMVSEFIGFAALNPIPSAEGVAELLYIIDRRLWNRGYGKESVAGLRHSGWRWSS